MQNNNFTLPFSKNWLLLIWVLLFFTGCNSDDSENVVTPEPNKYLVESTFIKDVSKEDIIKANALYAGYAKNNVKVYKITYNTTNSDGTAIVASGAVLLPVTDQSISMISVQHGTITSDASAPS